MSTPPVGRETDRRFSITATHAHTEHKEHHHSDSGAHGATEPPRPLHDRSRLASGSTSSWWCTPSRPVASSPAGQAKPVPELAAGTVLSASLTYETVMASPARLNFLSPRARLEALARSRRSTACRVGDEPVGRRTLLCMMIPLRLGISLINGLVALRLLACPASDR